MASGKNGRRLNRKSDLDMRAFRAAQVVRKRMRTDRKEITRVGYIPEPSTPLGLLQDAGIVAAYNPDPTARRALVPSGAKLPKGRPNLLLTLAPELGFLIGVDVSHSEVSVSVTRADFSQVVEEVRRVPIEGLDETPDRALDAAARLIRDLVGELEQSDGLSPEKVIGIGLGLPGPVDRRTRTIAPNMNILSMWSQHKPTEELSSRLADCLPEVPIEIDNDASLGAVGIYSYLTLSLGIPPDQVPRDLLYVRVSDGIGAGVVIKGKLVGGGAGFAGEIGHVKVDDRGSFCPRCGQRGCVETKTSERAVLAELKQVVFEAKPDELTIEQVLESTHPASFRSLHEAGWHLGAALAHARTLLDPTRIYIGGPMAQSTHFVSGVHMGIISNSLGHSSDPEAEVRRVVIPVPKEFAKVRPDLRSPELLGAIAMALHRAGDRHIERKLSQFQAG